MAFFSVFLAVAIHVIDLRDPGRLLWTGARDRAKALRAPSLEASVQAPTSQLRAPLLADA